MDPSNWRAAVYGGLSGGGLYCLGWAIDYISNWGWKALAALDQEWHDRLDPKESESKSSGKSDSEKNERRIGRIRKAIPYIKDKQTFTVYTHSGLGAPGTKYTMAQLNQRAGPTSDYHAFVRRIVLPDDVNLYDAIEKYEVDEYVMEEELLQRLDQEFSIESWKPSDEWRIYTKDL
ncbi:MAG TPA: hypothetical protein VG944_14575 [Fimbriimonas sp.]|nr:hypothetical protein [Fimbriimonas sp.]